MNLWDGLGVALVSAVVSLITALAFRWWDRRKPDWLVTGYADADFDRGKETGLVRIELEVHNIGDADVYDVRTRRCNGGTYPSWVTFEQGKLPAGDSFKVRFRCSPETWETAWMEVIARPTPVARRSAKTQHRVVLRDVTGPKQHSGGFRQDDTGRGRDLPASQGGRSD